jgi:flagellar M-ring protein FliF
MADGGQSGQALVPAGGAQAGSGLERVGALARDVRSRFLAMPSGRRTWLGGSALLVAAICAGMMWYAGRPDWRVLFSGLDAKDTQQIAQELTAAGITYQLTEDGTGMEVSADQVDKARMEVAAKGMPQSGRMGFELFDKPNWVGSEFDEKVNYQRALEGELEHTIGTLAVVRSARVHIVLAKESLFADGQRAAKASVVLQLRRSIVPPEQAEAIRSLVAGAVENLSPSDVTLVDADGRLNLAAPTQGAAAGDTERALEEKLVAMLEPTVGSGNVHATVNVAFDEGSEEKTDDVYDPTQTVPLNMHKTEQTSGGKQQASGVPGTASNTPGGAAPGSVQAGAAAAAKPTAAAPVPPLMQTAGSAQNAAALPVYPQNGSQGLGQTMTDETSSYAVTRHLLHTEEGPGRIRRVTAAVVVNDRMSSEGAGKLVHAVWKPRSPEEMQRLDQLTRAAVGFDATRGDQVVIENVGFSSNVPEANPAGLEKVMDETESTLHAQPALLKTLSLAGVSLLLVLVVLKPMTRQMMTALSQAPAAPLLIEQGGAHAANSAASAGTRTFGPRGVPSLASLVASRRPTDAQEIYEHISEQIRREPAQSTRLLESWINAPAEEED